MDNEGNMSGNLQIIMYQATSPCKFYITIFVVFCPKVLKQEQKN